MRVVVSLIVCSLSAPALAAGLTNVTDPSPKITGVWVPNEVSPELRLSAVVEGAVPLENPTASIGYYGYLTDGPMLPAPGDLPSANHKVEASKTEPDKNVYLVLRRQAGPDRHYDYGNHFLYQGHETGLGYFTRLNLDADLEHRVTLMASTDIDGNQLPTFDGITWDPFAQKLILTAEGGAGGGPYQASLEFPSTVEYLGGSFGRSGSEGVQMDSDGNVWMVEDSGGAAGSKAAGLNHAKQPNSFIYRFVPTHKNDLLHGVQECLQVLDSQGNPIVFNGADIDGDILGDGMKALHMYGVTYQTRWIAAHDTAVDGIAVFNANAAAKLAGCTPFKRPENGIFQPGTRFHDFYFTETGDTDSRGAPAEFGGFGALFHIHQQDPSSDSGEISMFFRGDVAHTGFDNIAFWNRDHVIAVEDAGDTLHTQRAALDSGYMFDTRVDYRHADPVRVIAEGRDPSATLDSAFGGMTGFQNEGDNEITGIHVSDGDPSIGGLLGVRAPHPFHDGWRVFWTQQHGNNTTWEILPARDTGDDD